MGDLKGSEQRKEYSFRLANTANGLTMDARSDAAMEYAVFWCNHEVALPSNPMPSSSSPAARRNGKIEYHFRNHVTNAFPVAIAFAKKRSLNEWRTRNNKCSSCQGMERFYRIL